ncbi:MAG: ribosome maturation factor RimP [Oscillospiraceae bacterium]|nr:ribosome maturation factor RimP [Oscillospiraceae bacterium]MDD7293043.1 ribosome maturation factor RimP [Clostridiaceae bacterium]MDY5991784.1 ribosome maturation factor RimP [Oscillospiraceae bacterium]
MAKDSNTVSAVRAIAEPIAQRLGLEIWDIRFLKEGTGWFLRIFIDKDGGVGIDDCVEMSRALNDPLDEADLIEQAYCLEVSSPGVERELVRSEHFQKYLGAPVKLKTIRPVDGKREFSGVLEDYDNGLATVRLEDGSGLTLSKKETAWIKLDDFSF